MEGEKIGLNTSQHDSDPCIPNSYCVLSRTITSTSKYLLVPLLGDMMSSHLYKTQIFTVPQTKLRKGNVFTPVCDSVHGGRVHPLGRHPPGRHPQAYTPPVRYPLPPSSDMATVEDSRHPTGMHSCCLLSLISQLANLTKPATSNRKTFERQTK